MKKLVAISVLFAGLATAVFAQDGGWSNAWKIGVTAIFGSDMFYAASKSGKDEKTQTTDPDRPAFIGDGTTTTEYGKYSKGVTHFFPNKSGTGIWADHKVFLVLTNSGENYDIKLTAGITNWANGGGFKVMDLINGGQGEEDWGVKGRAGIFEVGIGPWATEAAWAGPWPVQMWGSLVGWSDLNRFGVRRVGVTNSTGEISPGGSWIHSNHFRTLDQWGNPFSVGIKLGDQFKFTLGYKIDWPNHDLGNPTDSRSSMNGVFMLSGSPVDALAFDLFYAITGEDTNTFARPATDLYYNDPSGMWKNLIGAYVKVSAIENLALMVGYTVNFNAYETGGFLCEDEDYAQSKAVNYVSPIYSGIDLRLRYTGIENIGLKFQNNISFAGVKGDKVGTDDNKHPVYKDTIPLLFNEGSPVAFKYARTEGEGRSQDWFSWHTILQAMLGFIENVNIEVTLGNKLGVITDKLDRTVPVTISSTTTTTKTESVATTSANEFRAGVGATYSVSHFKLGVALYVSWLNESVDVDRTTTVTTATTGGSSTRVTKFTQKKSDDTVKFGIPVTCTVSF